MILPLTIASVVVADQAAKSLVRNVGTLQPTEGQLWVHRIRRSKAPTLWLWTVAAGLILSASMWLPGSQVFVGLLLGGSLSNAAEASVRGSVTDFVRLGFWPAFNLADVALSVGAAGMAIELLRAIGDGRL